MAKYSKLQVLNTMLDIGMVPLFYHKDATTAIKIVDSLYQGGARVVEFTSRGDFAFEVFEKLIAHAEENCPELILGIGSVTDAASASMYLSRGANFIVTPVLREDIAIICNRRKIPWFAGCGSLTEIARAEELGCDIIKLFPGSTYGPGFVKAVKGPQPWTSIMPTGGVTTDKDNLQGWFNAGVVCVGIGSQLISKEIINDKDFKGLENLVRDTLRTIQEIKK